MDERNAVARLKRGDIAGLAFLVKAYQVKAVRTATLITRDRELAEDVVQAAFIRVYQRIDQFDSERAFEPWFIRSVVNAAVNAAKQQQRQVSLDDEVDDNVDFIDLLPDDQPDPHMALEQLEMKEAVRAALDKLSPEQRAAVVMRYFLEMSEREMSNALDTSPGTIKWRLHAARKRLRGLLNRMLKPASSWEG